MANNINVHVHFDDELSPLSPQEQFIIDEFKLYKSDSLSISLDNFVAPNEGIQAKEASIHSLFGRDRVFDFPPEFWARIHQENLSHVHYDIDNEWTAQLAQWDCTSNSSVVYSGFVLDDEHFHFVIHELLIDYNQKENFDAHDYYQKDDLKYYLDNAEYYRKVISEQVSS